MVFLRSLRRFLKSSFTRVSWESVHKAIQRRFPNVPSVTTGQLAQWLSDPQRLPPLLFDVRSREEYEVSHLKNSFWAKDAESILRKVDCSTKSKASDVIVVYCSVGYRSANVVQQLSPHYDGQVLNLEGSIFQWFNEGRGVWRTVVQPNENNNDVQTSEVPTDQVHPFDRYWGKLLVQKNED